VKLLSKTLEKITRVSRAQLRKTRTVFHLDPPHCINISALSISRYLTPARIIVSHQKLSGYVARMNPIRFPLTRQFALAFGGGLRKA
jgi:hypothetical protein